LSHLTSPRPHSAKPVAGVGLASTARPSRFSMSTCASRRAWPRGRRPCERAAPWDPSSRRGSRSSGGRHENSPSNTRVLRPPRRRGVRALEALQAGPRFDQRAVHREVLLRKQSPVAGLGHHMLEEGAGDVAVQQRCRSLVNTVASLTGSSALSPRYMGTRSRC
jgi:hypothetical protein